MSEEICRVCMEKGCLINIFTEKDSLTLSAKIMSISKVSIYPNDGLPNTICNKCVKQLDKCLQFVKLCESSDIKLRTLLLETVDSEYNFDDMKAVESNYNDLEINKLLPKSESVKDLLIDDDIDVVKNVFNKCNSMKNESFPSNSETYERKSKQQCFTCGKVMSSKFRLKTHMRIHTGERPFTCCICKKSFTLEQNLKVHMRVHTGEKPLQCNICGASFAQSAGLVAHKRKHTGQTPYKCMLCPRSFRTIGHLQYHIRRHTGEKNFECPTCGRAFITNSDLKQHVRTHTGEKPHVCCICGLKVTRASHLKRHMQNSHSTKNQSTSGHKKKCIKKETENT